MSAVDFFWALLIATASGFLIWTTNRARRCLHKRRVYRWLQANSGQGDYEFRSTRAIASATNLAEDRVREICSTHKRIHMSTGAKPDFWNVRRPD